MRKLLIILFSFISFVVKAQVYQEMPQYGYRANRMAFDSTLSIPTTCGVPTLKSNIIKKAAIAFDSCNNKFYKYNPKTSIWSEISGATLDTTSLSNRINSKADTSALNLKVPYTGATSDVDLGTFQLNAHSVKITGTNGNGHIDLRHQTTDATANGQTTALFANSNGDLKWKNDNKYYTTLTTNQSADRVYTFQNKSYTIADSSDVSSKLNISDTSTMLSNYVRSSTLNGYLQKSDSTTYYTKYRSDTSRTNIYSAINLRVKYTDTASMLSPYFRRTDTILNTKLRINYSATTTDYPVVIKNTNASAVQSNVLSFDCSATGADQPIFTNFASTNPKGMVFFASNLPTSSSPDGAGFQIYSTTSTNFPGQMYFDGGAHNSSSIIFRTAQTAGTITQRMRIFANGNVSISSSAADAGFNFYVNGTGRFVSQLTTAGQLTSLANKTSAYTLLQTDQVITADATSAAFQVTLPTAASKVGQTYTIKRTNSGANNVTVGTTSSQTIDGSTTYVLSAQYKFVTVVSNGSNWFIISNN